MFQYTDSPISSQVNNPINAYLIDAGEVNCCVDNLGELGCIYENCQLIDVVYAASRGQAKKLFIEYYGWGGSSNIRCSLEWTDKMSIRELAKDLGTKPGVTDVWILDSQWPYSSLTAYGRKIYAEQSDQLEREIAWEVESWELHNGGQS